MPRTISSDQEQEEKATSRLDALRVVEEMIVTSSSSSSSRVPWNDEEEDNFHVQPHYRHQHHRYNEEAAHEFMCCLKRAFTDYLQDHPVPLLERFSPSVWEDVFNQMNG